MLRRTFKLLYTFRVDTTRMVTSSEIVSLDNIITRRFVAQRNDNLKPEDKFGTLATEKNFDYDGDEVEDEPEGEYFGKLDTIKKMKECLEAHEYDNAVELLRNMQKRKEAPTYAYKLLLSYNAKLGNIEEAFKLYNDYKKRGYFVRGAMYTSLFTACGNCQRSDIALPIAYKLARYLFESKHTKANLTNYHAMLKAFGRHGDLSAAFQLVDRLHERNSKITTETYNMLLEACITDRASGLRFALLVWHHMLKMKIKPDAFTFRNMAKCVHNCSLGDKELLLDFVKMIVGDDKINKEKFNQKLKSSIKVCAESQELLGEEKVESNYFLTDGFNHLEGQRFDTADMLENESSDNLNTNELPSNNISPNAASDEVQSSGDIDLVNDSNSAATFQEFELPNLLNPNPTCGSAIDFDDLSTPVNRFMLFGGLKGFFEVVDHFKVKPNIKWFNILIHCIPSTKEAEEELLEFKKKYKIKTDVRFMNVLLRRRIFFDDSFSFQDCIDIINKFRLSPDVETIRVLAEACKTHEEGMKCIEFTRKYKIRFSDKFIHALLKNASFNSDFDYMSDILAAVKEEGIQLKPISLSLLRSAINEAKLKKSVEMKQM